MKATNVVVKATQDQGKVRVKLDATFNGETTTQTMEFQFEDIGDGIKMLRITDEALQDLVALINTNNE